jgi:hypothetical protein
MNAEGKTKKKNKRHKHRRNDPELCMQQEVYKMYEDMVNEEVQEYVIKTLKQTKLKIYTEQELREREERGIEKGIEEKTRELAIKLLKKKFQNIPDDIIETINKIKDTPKIEKMVEDIFNINHVDDVRKYLN